MTDSPVGSHQGALGASRREESAIRARPSAWGALSILLALPALGIGQEGEANGIGQPVADYDKPPKPLKMTRPQYPKAAFDAKIEGTVVVEILIDEKGRVHPQRVLTSIPALDAAAIATVKEWVFSPATKKGHAVATIAHAPIGFRVFDKLPDQTPKAPSPSPPPPPPAPRNGTAGDPLQSSIAQETGAVEAVRGGRFLPLPEAFHSPRLTVSVSFYYNEGPTQSTPSNP